MKILNLTAVILSAAVTLCSCGLASNKDSAEAGGESAANAENKSISAGEILSGVNNDLLDGKAIKGEELFDKNSEKFYGVEISGLNDGGILYNTEGSHCDEVSVISLSNGGNAEDILKKRLDDRRATFNGYAPEEMPKFDSAEIFVQNGWGVLIISDDHENIAKQIKDKIG